MKKNKVVILFLVKFFLVYFSFTAMYSWYLSNTQQTDDLFACSPVTTLVTDHAEYVIELLGYDVYTDQNFDELSMMFMVNESYVVKIVEGCTSVSIMILFMAFVVAFSGRIKTTILYVLLGLVLIYLVNIFRIVLLSLVIYHHPSWQNFMHDFVFPAIIYGMVFLLWLIWVKKYATLHKSK
ncbi:exosortase family protein XrtF [Urechidicola vernalis]|uniref:Exosortase family protein XrtF n=1 Tax=Urechidicola vernalis TaxID=3075600 RepID=A0ABU2Y4Z2_9FLAO|nr:exosortase family protein XrtF [Urechidicola sp. P050]MDT0553264.1 exosortase family protein XrtF [Urechidicola sp. P050]